MDPGLLIGIALIVYAWYNRNGWPTAATTASTPAATSPAQTPILNLGGGGGDLSQHGGNIVQPMQPVDTGFLSFDAFEPIGYSSPFGDPGVGSFGRDPRYAPGVVDAGGGNGSGDRVDPSTLDWINQNYGKSAA